VGGGAVRVEFLYWEGCPSHDEALRRLKEVLAEEGVQAHLTEVRVETEEQARALQFPGSPTIRFNGVDVQPEMLPHLPMGLTCRLYRVEGRPSPLPSKEMIRQALRRALRKEESHGRLASG